MPSSVLVVGSGISAAAACAVLKQKCSVVVLEQRPHIGGNCYDTESLGTYIHQYGAHIYHNPNAELHEWTKQFTSWVPYVHSVTAEIADGRLVPFPYSRDTEATLGGELSDEGIIDTFFRGYSQKMWGKPWDALPAAVRNRLPKRQETSDFFPGQITALPEKGYTHFLGNMLDGCDVLTGVDPQAWQAMAPGYDHVIYCGRLDAIRTPEGVPLGAAFADPVKKISGWLNHVSLRIERHIGPPVSPTAVTNYCHLGNPAIRRVQHAQLTGGRSMAYHLEYPVHGVPKTDLTPFYPVPHDPDAQVTLAYLKARAKQLFPHMTPLGRIAQHQYLDMHQALGAGRALGLELLA